jgi:hypothetical protein
MLVVTYANKNAKGDVQRYIAGPFPLGRPRASCPKGETAKKGKRTAAKTKRKASHRG